MDIFSGMVKKSLLGYIQFLRFHSSLSSILTIHLFWLSSLSAKMGVVANKVKTATYQKIGARSNKQGVLHVLLP